MKAWILERQARIEEKPLKLVEFPAPRPKDNEIRIKIYACGICRTDIHIAEGDLPMKKSPLILGNELPEILVNAKYGKVNGNAVIRIAE